MWFVLSYQKCHKAFHIKWMLRPMRRMIRCCHCCYCSCFDVIRITLNVDNPNQIYRKDQTRKHLTGNSEWNWNTNKTNGQTKFVFDRLHFYSVFSIGVYAFVVVAAAIEFYCTVTVHRNIILSTAAVLSMSIYMYVCVCVICVFMSVYLSNISNK